MATTTGKAQCVTCGKEKATTKRGGCSENFCFNHLIDHRRELSKQLDEIEVTRDLFRQTLTEHTDKPPKHALIEQITEWERDSINKIRQTANEARETILKHTNEHIKEMEVKLNKLTDHLRQSREENDFYELDLRHWIEELSQLKEELSKPLNINFRHDSVPLVTKVFVDATSVPLHSDKITPDAQWIQNGATVAGGNGQGSCLNQLNYALGLYVDDDQTVYIAEHGNDRIVKWKSGTTYGQIVAGGNGPGKQANQLHGPTDVVVDKEKDCLIICDYSNRRVVRWPRRNDTIGEVIITNIDCVGLAMDNDGYLYISDCEKHEVRRWRIGDSNGIVVAGGKGRGSRLDQLNDPIRIFVDQDYSVYVSDNSNHRVMKWVKDAKEGIIVAGGHNQGSSLTQLSQPQGVIVDQFGTVYVSDWSNDRIMRWFKGATEGCIVVGGNGEGKQTNQLAYPVGLSFDRQGNLYVVDRKNHRVQRFNIDSS